MLYLLLVFGTTLGYPAWHQSLGLFVIMLPAMFVSGATVETHILDIVFKFGKNFFYPVLLFCVCLSITSSMLVIDRAHRWDSAFRFNVCAIDQDKTSVLQGAEIIYPIFDKGIEDIQSWDWMKKAYILWIKSQNFSGFSNCSEYETYGE